MEIRRITQTSDPLYEQAMALYTISFPFHEQRQALSQSQILQQDAYHFDVICKLYPRKWTRKRPIAA